MVVTSFQRTFPEEWGSSNENNHHSKMTNEEKWNYGGEQRGIMPSIKKVIIRYERAAWSSFDYDFAHNPQARLLCNDLLTKKNFLRELATVAEDLYHHLCLKLFGSRSSNKEARDTCWKIATTILLCIFEKLRAVRVVAEDAFNHSDRAK